MLGLGMGEILLIAALILIVVGPERLPEMMRWAGKSYGQLRRAADELRRSFVLEADRLEAELRLKDLEKRREKAQESRKRALDEAGPGTVAQEPPAPRIEPPAGESEAAPAEAADAQGASPDPMPKGPLMAPPARSKDEGASS